MTYALPALLVVIFLLLSQQTWGRLSDYLPILLLLIAHRVGDTSLESPFPKVSLGCALSSVCGQLIGRQKGMNPSPYSFQGTGQKVTPGTDLGWLMFIPFLVYRRGMLYNCWRHWYGFHNLPPSSHPDIQRAIKKRAVQTLLRNGWLCLELAK